MPGNATIPLEVGPRYDVGFVSAAFGSGGFTVKPGTYRREQQLIKRADVVASLQTALADRDINFWTRVSQFDWRRGGGQQLFTDGYFDTSRGIDTHVAGTLTIWSAQSVLDSVTTGAIGRGAAIAAAGVGGAAVAAFAWTNGNYRVSSNISNVAPAFSTFTTGAGMVLDIASDGSNFYFACVSGGVWTTTAAAPGNLTQYDTGANVYHRLAWDPLRRRLFGILAPSAGRALHQINSGGAATVIYDFQQGRLDAILVYFGYVYVGWNTGDAFNDSQGSSYIYAYDGTNMVEEASGADAGQIVGLKVADIRFWVGMVFNDVFNSPDLTTAGSQFSLCYSNGDQIVGFVNMPDGRLIRHSTTFSPMYGMQDWLAIQSTPDTVVAGQSFFGVGPYVWRWDQSIGGASRAFGRASVSVGGTSYTPHVVGLVAAGDKMVALALLLDGTFANVGGMVWQVSGLSTPNLIADADDNKLTSSRLDLSLPYVDKFWYGFEVTCEPLANGQELSMEYSINDGTTWNSCPSTTIHPNPFTTISGTSPLFLVNLVNPHIKYRLQMRATGGATTPIVHAVSAKFAPSNPNLKVWTMTLVCQRNMRLRNNQIDETEPRDLLDYLFNISQSGQTVDFYDNNETLDSGGNRVRHSVWIMQAAQSTVNTSGKYNPLLQEGEVEVVCWETEEAA